MNAKATCYLLWTLATALLPTWALASGQTPVYRIGVSNIDYYPYSEVREGEYRGLHRDLLDAFAAEARVRFEYVPLPYLRGVHEFLAGRLDFQYPDDPNWIPLSLGGAQITYSAPAIPYIDGVSLLAEHPVEAIEQLDSLGTILGFSPAGYLERVHAGTLRLSEQPHVQGLINQVLRQRLDGIYLNILVVSYQQRQMGHPDRLRFNPQLPYRVGFYRLSSLDYPELIAAFNRFLREQQPLVQTLLERYGISELLSSMAEICQMKPVAGAQEWPEHMLVSC